MALSFQTPDKNYFKNHPGLSTRDGIVAPLKPYPTHYQELNADHSRVCVMLSFTKDFSLSIYFSVAGLLLSLEADLRLYNKMLQKPTHSNVKV